MAAGLTRLPGSEPPDQATAAPPAWWTEAHCHLGSAGVRAQEQHGRPPVVGSALDLGQGVEALSREAFGEEGQEVGDGGMAGELVVGGVQEPFDGFGVERAVEVAFEPGGGSLERDDLVEGDVMAVVDLRHRRSLLRDRFKTRVGDGARDR